MTDNLCPQRRLAARWLSIAMLLATLAMPLAATSTRPARARDATPEASPSTAAFPVTVENCGRTLTFDAPPERVVTMHPLTAEILLRLGVESTIVGAAFGDGDPVAPDLRSAYDALPVLTADAPPSREALLQTQPDLVVDNFPFLNFNEEMGYATEEQLADAGAQVYTMKARCSQNEAGGSLEDIFTDVEDLGAIFGVPNRAHELVESLEGRLDAVARAIAGEPAAHFLIYDSGEGPINVYGPGSISGVAEAAGGVNVFADRTQEFNMLSPEEISVVQPDVFVIPDYQAARTMDMAPPTTPEQKVEYLVSTFPDSPAARDRRFVIVPYQQLRTSLQNIDGVEALARAFHPDAFAAETATSADSPGSSPVADSPTAAWTTCPLTVERCAVERERYVVPYGDGIPGLRIGRFARAVATAMYLGGFADATP